MRKYLLLLLSLVIVSCSSNENTIEYPEYNHIAAHVNVVKKTADFVTYDYKDIAIDEVAPIAAIYCYDRGQKQAVLFDITLRPDNMRRVTFFCRKMTKN